MNAQQDLKGASAAFRKAIELNPKYAEAYNNLGNALYAQQDLKGASAAFRHALVINPKFAEAHVNLGLALRVQGEFAQALGSFKEGAKWLPISDRRRAGVLHLIRSCQRQADLEMKLPAILSGKQQPQNNGERIEYAKICNPKQLYAAVARFCEQAFAVDLKMADDLKAGNRYNAASAAALAAAGQGKDAPKLDNKERTRWRMQAVAWLRADLALLAKVLDKNTPQVRTAVQQFLQHWQKNRGLAGIRDAAALAKLPPEEQAACKKLWADVAALLKKAAAKP
jgi:tetratricopeptide (TPR) repeat protein